MKSAPGYTSQDSLIADLPDNEHDTERLQGDHAILDLPEVKDIPGQEHITVMPLGEMADVTISSADEEGAGLLDFEDDDDDDEDDMDDDVLTEVDEENSVVIDTEEEVDFDDDDLLADDDLDEDDLDEDDLDEDEEDDDIVATATDATAPGDSGDAFDEADKADDASIDANITPGEIDLLDQGGPVERYSDTDNLNRSKLDDTDLEGAPLNEISSGNSLDGSDLDTGDLDSADPTKEALGQNDEENSIYSVADTE